MKPTGILSLRPGEVLMATSAKMTSILFPLQHAEFPTHAAFAGMASRLDRSVGRIVDLGD